MKSLLLFFLLIGFILPAAAQPPREATMLVYKGQALLTPTNCVSAILAEENCSLQLGDRIETDGVGRVEIQWSDGTFVRMGVDSAITLISTGIQLDYGSLYLSSTGKRHGFLLKVKEAMLIASRGTQMTISRDSDVPEFEIQTIFGSINVRDFLSHGSMNLSRGDALTSRGRFHIDHFHLFPFLPAKTELIWQRFWDYDWTSTLARQGDDLEQRNSRIYRRKAKEIDYRYHLNRQSKPHEENRDSVHYFYTESAPKRPYQERRDWQHPFGRTRK